MSENKVVIPFRTGDVVSSTEKGWEGEHIIHRNMFYGDSFQYATNHGAWLEHEYLTLVRPADAESITDLRKALVEEEEGEVI